MENGTLFSIGGLGEISPNKLSWCGNIARYARTSSCLQVSEKRWSVGIIIPIKQHRSHLHHLNCSKGIFVITISLP